MSIIHEQTKEVVFESKIDQEVKDHYAGLLFLYKCLKATYCPFTLCDKK